MQVKNRIFPYPVINYDQNLSSYKLNGFNFIYESDETEFAYVLKNARFDSDSKTINELFDQGLIEVSAIVECSNTVYRKAHKLTKTPIDITLMKVDFDEKVVVSIFAYAVNNFMLSSTEFDDDYLGLSFEVEKYDIIGANDGFTIRFKHLESEDNLVQSIFSVGISHDLADNMYIVECNIGKKIAITLSDNDYKNYKIIYTVPTYKEVFFNMLLVPALIEGLSLCKMITIDKTKDLDDVGNQYYWFRSIQNAYRRLKGRDMTLTEFNTVSPVFIAQELLGQPLGKSLKNLVIETNRTDYGGSENE